MAVQKIYIVRHGYRLNWVMNQWQSETGLPRDPPLAAFGKTQSKELAVYFSSLPQQRRPTAIFSSPFCQTLSPIFPSYRCLETSQPIAAALGIPLYVEHGISEWYTPVKPGTGLHPRPSSATILQTYFPEIDDSWSSIWYPPRKGESVDEVHDRAVGFLRVFAPELERRLPGKHTRILLVSHAATAIALARALLVNRTLPIRVGCCSLTEIVRKGDTWQPLEGWEAETLASGSHLKDGASRDWGFEDIEISRGKVVEDSGVLGSETELDEPVGSVLPLLSNL